MGAENGSGALKFAAQEQGLVETARLLRPSHMSENLRLLRARLDDPPQQHAVSEHVKLE